VLDTLVVIILCTHACLLRARYIFSPLARKYKSQVLTLQAGKQPSSELPRVPNRVFRVLRPCACMSRSKINLSKFSGAPAPVRACMRRPGPEVNVGCWMRQRMRRAAVASLLRRDGGRQILRHYWDVIDARTSKCRADARARSENAHTRNLVLAMLMICCTATSMQNAAHWNLPSSSATRTGHSPCFRICPSLQVEGAEVLTLWYSKLPES
jgi:hypothetical protein